MDFFQNTGFKESGKMALKKSFRVTHDKLSLKVMSFSYHIEWKTFTKASCANNIHTGETTFYGCYF